MTARTLANVVTRTGRSPAEALRSVLASAGQERLLSTSEVATAALELCIAGSSHINGRTVTLQTVGGACISRS